jgi:hypothetical protein
MGEDEERVIAVEVNESLRGENQVSNEQRPEIQAVHEMNQIASSREGKEALQRAATGQELSPAQAALVNEYKALEQQHNAQAKPAYSGGTFKTARPFAIPKELFDLERIAGSRERLFALRQLRSEWRDNPKSPYNDVQHPEHKNYIGAMTRLYEAEQALGPVAEDPQE